MFWTIQRIDMGSKKLANENRNLYEFTLEATENFPNRTTKNNG